ncbi:MAG: VOC family protein [Elusimicrobiota bacterium]
MKKPFQNLVVDHMTFLVEPRFYGVTYALFRIIFGVGPEDILYEKRGHWPGDKGEKSMTFAARIGRMEKTKELGQSIIAVVQPSEPKTQKSHVRDMLKNRGGSAHWQHIALRTPDLLSFHRHAARRGVNFITPILKDSAEDLIQVFSGEWILPGRAPSGIFFEFVQRNPGSELLKKIAGKNRESWFRDKTFLGLYQEKENEYRSGRITPFIDPGLFFAIEKILKSKALWDISSGDLLRIERAMLAFAQERKKDRD